MDNFRLSLIQLPLPERASDSNLFLSNSINDEQFITLNRNDYVHIDFGSSLVPLDALNPKPIVTHHS